jgi:hypothetical protein
MNTFHQTINLVDGGKLSDDLAEKLADLIGKVKERGKAGTLSLTLKIKPLNSDADSVSLSGGIKVTEPAKVERASIFFTTDDNRLVQENPAQQVMKLEPVEKPAAPVQPVAKTA